MLFDYANGIQLKNRILLLYPYSFISVTLMEFF